jgi:ABC-2 type transport system permease protein
VASDSTTFPLGFDRYMNQQFGNRDFIQNAVLYLADDPRWLELRSRSIKLRLLNKQVLTDQKLVWQLVSVVAPILLLVVFAFISFYWRKRKYSK